MHQIRHGLALLALAASAAAPSMSRNTRGARGPFGHRPVRNAEGAAASSSGTGTTPTTGSSQTGGDAAAAGAATKAAEKTFTQAELDAIVQKRVRELKPAADEAAALRAKLEEYEKKQQEEAEAKLSATERAKREQERREADVTKKLSDAEARATRERDLRHASQRAHRAAAAVSSFASKLLNDKLAPVVEREIASRLVVEAQADGSERLMVRMSDAAADLEPVETGLAKLIESDIAPVYFRAQGGAGSQHGTGAGGSTTQRKGADAFSHAFSTKPSSQPQ